MGKNREDLDTLIDIISEDLILTKYFKVKSTLAKRYDLAAEFRDIEKSIRTKQIEALNPLEKEIHRIATHRINTFMRNNLEFMMYDGKFHDTPTRTLSRTLSGLVKKKILNRSKGNEYSLNE